MIFVILQKKQDISAVSSWVTVIRQNHRKNVLCLSASELVVARKWQDTVGYYQRAWWPNALLDKASRWPTDTNASLIVQITAVTNTTMIKKSHMSCRALHGQARVYISELLKAYSPEPQVLMAEPAEGPSYLF